MEKRKGNLADSSPSGDLVAGALERIARILAISVVRSAKREDQVMFLHSVGYTPGEIAAFLELRSNAVSVLLYQRKKKSAVGNKKRKR